MNENQVPERKQRSLQTKTKSQLRDELEELRQRMLSLETLEVKYRELIADLHESEQKYRILLDESSDPIFTFTPEGQYRYVNKAFADGVGMRQDEIIGRKIWDVFSQDEADKRFAAVKWVFEHGDIKVIEVLVPRPDGDNYYITTVKPIINGQGKVVSVICISKEITERKRMEQELHHLSTHDVLTGLYNRNYFEIELDRLQQGGALPTSIVVADMDNLKAVNDLYGHNAGDELIQKVAQVLRQSFRAEDFIARIGGDEFAILLKATDQAAAEAIVARLRESLRKQQNALLSLSIGVACCEDKHCQLSDVMRLADDRMFQDKISHKMK